MAIAARASLLEVDVKPATLEVARAFQSTFSNLFYPRGWLVSVHGSSIEFGRGRDLDFVFNLIEHADGASGVDDVVLILKRLGLDVRVDERRGRWRGIVGLMRGYALDVTLIGGER